MTQRPPRLEARTNAAQSNSLCADLCPLWRSQTAFAPILVRYASRSNQTIAAQRNDATCQKEIFKAGCGKSACPVR
jgi:hypothetical protein